MYRRSNGIFYADFKTVAGQRINKSLGTDDPVLAKQKENALRQEYLLDFDDGDETELKNTLLNHAYTHHAETWAHGSRGGRPQLVQIKEIAEIIGNLDVNLIDSKKIIDLKEALLNQKKKPATVNRYLHTLSGVLRYAHEKGALRLFPKIQVLHEEAVPLEIYSPEEEAQILAVADAEMQDLILVLAQTGARLSEILQLKSSAIDFEANTLTLGTKKPRVIPLSPHVKQVLLKRVQTYPDQPFVNLSINDVEARWQKIRKALNKDDSRKYTLQTFRHTCANKLLHAGVSIYAVKDFLGHSTIRITKRYTQTFPSHLNEALSALFPD